MMHSLKEVRVDGWLRTTLVLSCIVHGAFRGRSRKQEANPLILTLLQLRGSGSRGRPGPHTPRTQGLAMAGFPASLRSLGPLCEAALGGLPLPGGPECGGPGGAARVLLLGLELGTPGNLAPLESGTSELWASETGTRGTPPGPMAIPRVDLALLSASAVRALCAGLHGGPTGAGHPGPDSSWDWRPQPHGVRCTDPGSPARVEDCPDPALQEGYRSVLRELLGTTGTLGSLLDALLCSPERLLSHSAVQVATALCLLLERKEVPSFETSAWVSAWVSACVSRLTGALSRTQLATLGQAEAAWALSDLVSALAREEASSGRTSEGLAHVLRFLDPVWPTLMDRVFTHAPQIPSPPPPQQPLLLLLALLELQDALVRSGSRGAAGRFPFSCDGARCLLSFLARPAAPYPAVRRLAGHLKRWLVRSARRRADTSCNAHPTGAHPTGVHRCADAEGVVCLARTLVHAVHTGWLQSIHIHRATYHLGGQASSSPPWEESAASQLHREEQLCMGSCHISCDRSSGVPSSYFDWPAIDLVTLRGVVLSVLVAAVVCAANLDSAGVRTCVGAAARFALGFLDGPAGPCTPSPLTSHRCLWLVTLFGDQDDDLVEAAMSLLLLRPHLDPDDDDGGGAAIPWSERVGVGAACAFVSILRHACFSPVVLLDLLISSETRFLQLLVLVLRHVRATPHALAQACLTADLHGHTGPTGAASPPTGIHRGQGDQRKPPPPRGEERSPERRSQRRRQSSVCKQGAVAEEELGKKKQRRLVDYESSEDDADGGGNRRDECERGTHWASGPESRQLCLRDDENGARVNEDNDEIDDDDESDDDHLNDSDVDDGDDSDNDDNESSDAAEGVHGDDAVADLDEVDDDVGGGVVAPVPTLLSVLRCLSGLQLRVQRLWRRHLFPYDARPLLRLLSQAQASCAGLCSSSRPSSSPPPVNTSSASTDSHRDP